MESLYHPCAAVSCAVFLLLYKYVSPNLSAYFCPGYKGLSNAKQVEWNTRTLSSLHSIVVSFTCLYVLVYDEQVDSDPVWVDSPLVKTNCAIVIGYMSADILIMLVHFGEVGELFYIFHHSASIYAYYFVVTYGCLAWFANFRLIAEFSTPFVNQRWFFDVLGYPKTSTRFLINGVVMAVIFFMARVMTIPLYWYKVYSIYNTPAYVKLGLIWYVLLSSCITLDTINMFWFVKIVRGATKVIKSNKLYKSRQDERKVA